MSRASALLQLQTLDLELDAHRVRLQSIEQELGADPAVQAAQRAVADGHGQLQTARIAVQSLEYEAQGLAAKLAEVSDRIYGGRVTNPKVLQDLQHENESLQRRRAALEEKQFEALITAETAEGRQEQLQLALDAAETASANAHGSLRLERDQHQLVMANLAGDREAVVAQISPADRETYERLRPAKKGRAVAVLDEGVCGACGVELSSALNQSARQSADLVLCRNCGRILCAS
ncbi:MAG: hypothetical protein IT317_07160 [Anaerolineales bacterium]|nr:hypothetical protein [Anaerolineales bacterium]